MAAAAAPGSRPSAPAVTWGWGENGVRGPSFGGGRRRRRLWGHPWWYGDGEHCCNQSAKAPGAHLERIWSTSRPGTWPGLWLLLEHICKTTSGALPDLRRCCAQSAASSGAHLEHTWSTTSPTTQPYLTAAAPGAPLEHTSGDHLTHNISTTCIFAAPGAPCI